MHRDLKSRNVLLLTEDDRPSAERARDRVGRTDRTDHAPRVARAKVCDFGIAKVLAHTRAPPRGGGGNTLAAAFGAIGREASAEVTLGAGAGTPAWMAPERFRGGNEAFRAEDREDRGRSGSSGSGSANKSSEGSAAALALRAGESGDAFSFGVVLWEMLTGRVPWGWVTSHHQIIFAVAVEGRRLPLGEDGV